MKALSFSVLISLALIAISCNKEPDGPKQPLPINLTAKAGEVITSSNGFGIDLFRVTASDETGNMMLSPLSASVALTMLLNGCEAATYDQIRDMLGYQGLTLDEINEAYNSLVTQLLAVDPEVQLALANAVWYRQDFQVKPEFLNAMDSSFDAKIAALDFSLPASVETINGWASFNTNGKITKVIEDIDPDMVMFLMNALYFKGNWTYQFDPDQTSPSVFHLPDGSTVDVPMMHNTIEARTYSDDAMFAAELPYGRQNFAMVIIVPQGPLGEYMEEFEAGDWAAITAGLDSYGDPTELYVSMPKFRFEYEKYLNDQLKALGMVDAFEPFVADLSGIADTDLVVDFVKQNTYVDVNEEGTEAAAVTTIGIKELSMPPEFVADKPFIFAIRERMSNSLLFIGKVENPLN